MPIKFYEKRTVHDEQGKERTEYFIRQLTRRRKYYKLYTLPDSDAPFWFGLAILEAMSFDKVVGMFIFDMRRLRRAVRDRASVSTITRYLNDLLDAEFIIRVDKGVYAVNPGYLHSGNQQSTDDAIEIYDEAMKEAYEEEGKNPEDYVSVTETLKKRRILRKPKV